MAQETIQAISVAEAQAEQTIKNAAVKAKEIVAKAKKQAAEKSANVTRKRNKKNEAFAKAKENSMNV